MNWASPLITLRFGQAVVSSPPILVQLCLLFAFLTLTCKAPEYFAKQQIVPTAKVLIGHVENREKGWNPYAEKNISDMLKFELIRAGYSVLSPSQEEIFNKPENHQSDDPKKENLTPQEILKIASGANPKSKPTRRILTDAEVIHLSAMIKFDYFLQGAVSLLEEDKILEEKKSGVLFIDIYDASGSRLGAFAHTGKIYPLSSPENLREICRLAVETLKKGRNS